MICLHQGTRGMEIIMKKWYDEEYEWEIEVTGFLSGEHTEHYCRNGEEIGDKLPALTAVR